MNNDLLNDSTIYDAVKNIKAMEDVELAIKNNEIAYILQNIDGIKELIRFGKIENSVESVLYFIKDESNHKIIIRQSDDVVKILKKNGIYTDSRLNFINDMKSIGIICVFISIVFVCCVGLPLIFASYEIDIIKSCWLAVIICAITLFIGDTSQES